MKQAAVVCLFLAVLAAAASAQPAPVCRVMKSFNAVANTGMVQDTINAPVDSSFPVASVKVSNLVLGHPDVASLQVTLLHRTTPDAALTSFPLKPAADAVGAYAPDATAAPVSGSAGQWVLRISDTLPGADQRVISLASWTLQLCPGVTASDGKPDSVSVDISKAGVSVSVGGADSDDKEDKETKSGLKVADSAKGMLELLFPGLKAEDSAPDGVLGAIVSVKAAGRDVVSSHVEDTLKLVADGSGLYKGYVNKKIADVISGVNSAGSAAQGLITNKGGLFSLHDKTLLGFLGNLKAAVAADAQDKVETVLQAASQLSSLSGSVTGDLKSSAGLVAQLIGAGLANTFKLYTTAEGAAKTHIDSLISAKASVLEGLLDKIITVLSAAKESPLTGPVVDFKVDLDLAKLKALAAALDRVDDAIKALPTPSGFVLGKFSAVGEFWQQTRVAELLSAVSDGPVMSHLSDKLETARGLLKAATAPVVATDGGN